MGFFIPSLQSVNLLPADEMAVKRDQAKMSLSQPPEHIKLTAQVVLSLRAIAVHSNVQALTKLGKAIGLHETVQARQNNTGAIYNTNLIYQEFAAKS